jgi:HEAT repeat protein
MPSASSWRYGLLVAGLVLVITGLHAADAPSPVDPDEALLKANGVEPSHQTLVTLLKSQMPSDARRQQIRALIERLGDDRAANREAATQKLIELGHPAIPFLRQALSSTDAEVRVRAEKCLECIGSGGTANVAGAAIRTLVRQGGNDTTKLLLDYFAAVAQEDVEDEVLAGLTSLAYRDGKVAPALVAAARGPAGPSQAAAGYTLARVGDAEQRGLVRDLLASPNANVRRYTAHGLLGELSPRNPDEVDLANDEKVLASVKLSATSADLTEFFRKRVLRPADRQQIEGLVRALGSDHFQDREDASRKLVEFGASVLPFVREAMRSTDQEVVRRSETCIEEVEKSPGPGLALAAARVLAARPSDDAVATLLEYLPFADNDNVEQATRESLCLLAIQQPKAGALLTAGLKDPDPKRRAAAAWVLGRVGDQEQCLAVRGLLQDANPLVRLRASQGLLEAKDKSALPVLVALLKDCPPDLATQALAQLEELAHDTAPQTEPGDSPESRQKAHDLWASWCTNQGTKLELRQVVSHQLGLTLVAELQNRQGTGNHISEIGPDGKARWDLTGLQSPIDGQVLRDGRILVAEYTQQRVAEFDTRGELKWEHKLQGFPVACQRLANGNTFVVTRNFVTEFTAEGKELYKHTANQPNLNFIFDGCRLHNGNFALTTNQGAVIEMDTTGKTIRTVQPAGVVNGWAGVSETPNHHLLIAYYGAGGRILEVDGDGKTTWECKVEGACHAVRLFNGHTMVACMETQRIVEIDRAGKTVSERKTNGRPFHVHPR